MHSSVAMSQILFNVEQVRKHMNDNDLLHGVLIIYQWFGYNKNGYSINCILSILNSESYKLIINMGDRYYKYQNEYDTGIITNHLLGVNRISSVTNWTFLIRKQSFAEVIFIQIVTKVNIP